MQYVTKEEFEAMIDSLNERIDSVIRRLEKVEPIEVPGWKPPDVEAKVEIDAEWAQPVLCKAKTEEDFQ